MAKEVNSFLHKVLYFAEWGIPEKPFFFDHDIDLFYLFTKKQKILFLERGLLNNFAIKENSNLLEIGCGDSFFQRISIV